MKKYPENNEIINDEAYFKTVLYHMNCRDFNKFNKIEKIEKCVGTAVYGNNEKTAGIDDQLQSAGLLNWIELIENQGLYRAVKKLSKGDKIFLSRFVVESKTQKDMAKIYGLNKFQTHRKCNKIISRIRFYSSKK